MLNPKQQSKVDKFNKLADSLSNKINQRSNLFSNCNVTARRARFIESGRQEAERLEKLQKALRALAKMWSISDQVGLGLLANVSNRKQVEKLLSPEYATIDLSYPKYYEDLVDLGLDTYEKFKEAKNTLIAYMGYDEDSDDKKKQREIRKLEIDLIGSKIPGYFPTPENIVQYMVNKANISDGMRVLEPSAGKGNIADYIQNNYNVDLVVIEINSQLCEILKLKNHNIIAHNFMDVSQGYYDRIIMNPPFENYQDVDHVLHAYNNLTPGGILVSIMAASAFNNSHKKAQEFRDWLNSVGADYEKLPDGSFKNSERSTGVNCYLIVVGKD